MAGVVAAVNLSPATAAVQIKGELTEGKCVVAASHARLDYVPAKSGRKGGLFFRDNLQVYRLKVRASNYTKP